MKLFYVLLLVIFGLSSGEVLHAQATDTPTATATFTPTNTPTATATATPTATPTFTLTPTPELNRSWTIEGAQQEVVLTYTIRADEAVIAVLLFAILTLFVLFLVLQLRQP